MIEHLRRTNAALEQEAKDESDRHAVCALVLASVLLARPWETGTSCHLQGLVLSSQPRLPLSVSTRSETAHASG